MGAHAVSGLESSLAKYSSYGCLYRSLKTLGAADIINQFFGLSGQYLLPLSLAHGVHPLGECSRLDCSLIEPLHWAYNDTVYFANFKVKHSVKLPHPWLLLLSLKGRLPPSRRNSLLVGPPPSATNDLLLWNYIQESDLEITTFLLKKRGPYFKESRAFWRSKSIDVVSVNSYQQLYDVLSRHRYVYSPLLSSVFFFAASLGSELMLLPDYSFYAYEADLEDRISSDQLMQFRAPWSGIAKACQRPGLISRLSSDILGSHFLRGPEELSEYLACELESCTSVVNVQRELSHFQFAAYHLLSSLGVAWPGLYQKGLTKSIKNKFFPSRDFTSARLDLIKYPSISDYCRGVPNEIMVRDCPTNLYSAGWGADPPAIY